MPAITFDVAFHPETLQRAAASKPFKDMIIGVAMEAVAKKWSHHANKPVTLNKKFHILKRVGCMGGKPAIMSVRKDAAEREAAADKSAAEIAKRAEARAKAASGGAGGSSGAAAKPKPRKTKTKAAALDPASNKASGSSGAARKLPDGREVPAFTLVHRGKFELGDHMSGGPQRTPSSRPKELAIKIVLGQLVRCLVCLERWDSSLTPTLGCAEIRKKGRLGCDGARGRAGVPWQVLPRLGTALSC